MERGTRKNANDQIYLVLSRGVCHIASPSCNAAYALQQTVPAVVLIHFLEFPRSQRPGDEGTRCGGSTADNVLLIGTGSELLLRQLRPEGWRLRFRHIRTERRPRPAQQSRLGARAPRVNTNSDSCGGLMPGEAGLEGRSTSPRPQTPHPPADVCSGNSLNFSRPSRSRRCALRSVTGSRDGSEKMKLDRRVLSRGGGDSGRDKDLQITESTSNPAASEIGSI